MSIFSYFFLRRLASLSVFLHILNLVIFFPSTLLYLHVFLLNYAEILRYQVENLWGKKLPISLVLFQFCSRLLFYEVKRVYRITNFLTLFCVLINWNVLFVSWFKLLINTACFLTPAFFTCVISKYEGIKHSNRYALKEYK